MDLDSLYIRDGILPGEINTKQPGKIGANLVENAVLSELGWLFAHNTLENDYGIDAYIERREVHKKEKKEDIRIYGQIIALQIKSTDKEKPKNEDYRVHFSEAQKNYWTKHTLPILIIKVDRQNKECYWQEFREELVKKKDKTADNSGMKYYIDIPTGQKLDKDHKHQITTIAVMGKQNKLKTYLNQLDLLEIVEDDTYEIRAVFDNETTDFHPRYLGRIVTLEGIAKEKGFDNKFIEKPYIVPFINNNYEYDESLDSKIALEKFFDWANVKTVKPGEYYLSLKNEFKEMVAALKTIKKIVQ
ncbi:DUF4365 domain-containing protein [Bacillus wiedmannii]|uniref:DUF4365 domain-containing protein n=1 Tax=Bacillus wiedmannii TaxID=1890302 RepID=UPI0021CDEE2F|nr:DUF4365 domain-containing protein [Bacillus wiedmannii]MCU5681270.1 DUF4365 domain-containing protein [Bacillus wiedmannii]